VSTLDSVTFPEAGELGDLLIVPLGSTEQHGPHLPLGTDTAIGLALARRLSAGEPRAVVAPPLAYGASGEHQAFPGTISIGQEALRAVIVELVRSATETFPRVLLLNAHGGNLAALMCAERQLREEGRDVRVWSPAAAFRGDAHAGDVETSVMLALGADVRLDRIAAGNSSPLAELMEMLASDGVRAVSENGILGDPTTASAERGEALLDAAVAALHVFVTSWLTPVEAR
jgi:mycofactocin system creatininase family protein